MQNYDKDLLKRVQHKSLEMAEFFVAFLYGNFKVKTLILECHGVELFYSLQQALLELRSKIALDIQ